ncbi:hypothetical protein G7046_g3293 [Stylonectria norvegica]|nr:hypothetical protein G7046_g3293 [Stylonectria norvegica]
MKSSIFSLAVVAGLVAAQSGKIPDCAVACVAKWTTGEQIAGCKQLDVKCICSNADFLSGIACCLDAACDAAGKEGAVKYAQGICGGQGVKVPDKVTCNSSASGSATGSSTSSATGSASDSTASATGTAASETESSAATGTSASAAASSSGTAAAAAASASSTAGAVSGNGAQGVLGAVIAVMLAL